MESGPSVGVLGFPTTTVAEGFPVAIERDRPDGSHADRLAFGLDVSVGALRVWSSSREEVELGGPQSTFVDLADRVLDHQGAFEDLVRTRGVVQGWSPRSRSRMLYRLAGVDWSAMPGIPEMVTLTYPGEFPRSGRVAKQHLHALRRRWVRRWGPIVGAWKLEFQRRGAPHFHLYVGRPAVSVVEFRAWLSQAWFEVVGSGDERHLRAGTGLDRRFCSRSRSARAVAWYFARHGLKSGSKQYQNVVPEGFADVGRFWGLWGLASTVETVHVTPNDYVQLRRVVIALRRAAVGRGRMRSPGGLQGCWVLVNDGAGLARALGRWVSGVEPSPAVRSRRLSEALAWSPPSARAGGVLPAASADLDEHQLYAEAPSLRA